MSKVCDLVLKSGSDLLEAERQLFVLGCRVLVQRLDDLGMTAPHFDSENKPLTEVDDVEREDLPRRSTCWHTGTADVRPPECSACLCVAAKVAHQTCFKSSRL